MYPSQGKYMLAISTLDKNVYNEILIRRLLPLQGVEQMKKLRGTKKENELTNGPGKVVEAFGLNRDFDGLFVNHPSSGLWIMNSEFKDISVKKEREVASGNSEDFVCRYSLNQPDTITSILETILCL